MQPDQSGSSEHGDLGIGVGATEELSLRVSVATLVRVLFHAREDADDCAILLALERTATLRENDGRSEVVVRAKPFGGGVRLTGARKLRDLIGEFRFDSERSRREGDFRIQIRPGSWDRVKQVCLDRLEGRETGILDAGPEHELLEEFADTLQVRVSASQFHLQPRGMIVENLPSGTENVRAAGRRTVRIYTLFEAWMQDPDLIALMLTSSKRFSDRDLQELARNDARQGGRGRANAILVVGLEDLKERYRAIPIDRRGDPQRMGAHQFDGNVPALLDGVETRKYERLDSRLP